MFAALTDNYLLVLGGAVFFLCLLYLMFIFTNYIPHVLIATYFGLPLVYKLTGLDPLPLTTAFTVLLGPIVLWRSKKVVLIYLWPVACYLVMVFTTSVINHVPILENKSALVPIIITTLCMLSFSKEQYAPNRLQGFTYLIIGWIILNSIFSILQMFKGQSFYLISATKEGKVGEIQRGYGLIGMATQVGINFCLGVPLVGALLFEKGGKRRLFLYLVFAVSMIGLVLSFSRGAFLGVFVSFFFMMLLHRRAKLLVVYLLLAGTLIVSYSSAMTFLPAKYGHFFLGKDDSAGGRMPYVKIGLKMFADRPFTGFGYGGFTEQCVRYGSRIKIEAHNTYVQVLVEYGILGLSAFLLMILFSARGYIGYIRQGRSPTLRTLCVGYFAALIALAINAVVHCIEWNLIFWLVVIFGFLMRHHRLAERYEQECAL
jgi:hypothetical protein